MSDIGGEFLFISCGFQYLPKLVIDRELVERLRLASRMEAGLPVPRVASDEANASRDY
jgi:hypothetical protein